MNEITVLLRDDSDHIDFNKQLMSFLNEKYTYMNKNGFIIRPIIVDDINIDNYAKAGIKSLPALLTNKDHQENGVNNIIEYMSINMVQPSRPKKIISSSRDAFQELLKSESKKTLEEVEREKQEDEKKMKDGNMNTSKVKKIAEQFNYVGKDPRSKATKMPKSNPMYDSPIMERQSFSARSPDNVPVSVGGNQAVQSTQSPTVVYDDLDHDEKKFLNSFADAPESDDEDIYMPDYSLN